jgi:hypothetical protein
MFQGSSERQTSTNLNRAFVRLSILETGAHCLAAGSMSLLVCTEGGQGHPAGSSKPCEAEMLAAVW